MRDNLEWLGHLKVSEIIRSARHRIIKTLQQEYTDEAKIYLKDAQEQGRPFITCFRHEPSPIIETKNFLNALFDAEDTFHDLETALSEALGQSNVLGLLSLAQNAALVNKAFSTIEQLTQSSAHFFDLFKDELNVVLPFFAKFKYFIPQIECSQDTLSKASLQVGLFVGHAINQMNPISGEVNYSLLTEFGAIVPAYLRQASLFIESNLSKISNYTPEENKAKLDELSQLGEKLGYLIQHSSSGKLFFLANLIPIIQHVQRLLGELTQAADSLNDVIKNSMREYMALLKLKYMTGLFACIDKLEIECLLTAGRLSTPLMLQMTPFYELSMQWLKEVLDLSVHGGESLVKLVDRRFIELRLKPTQQRLVDLNKSLYLIEQAQKKLANCVNGLGYDEICDELGWRGRQVSGRMSQSQRELLQTNYAQLKVYLVAIEHPILAEIENTLTTQVANQTMKDLLSELEKVLTQAHTDRLFKKKLHEQLIASVYQQARMALFPYNRLYDTFDKLRQINRITASTINHDDGWDQFSEDLSQYNQLQAARNACDDYRRLKPDFSFYPNYRLESLHDRVIHKPCVLYLKIGQATVSYEILEYHPEKQYNVHLMSLESAQEKALWDCFVWDENTYQLFYIDRNRNLSDEVSLKNKPLFQSVINLKKYRPKKEVVVFTSDLIKKYIIDNGSFYPGIVHKGSIALSWLSHTLHIDSKLKDYEPYQAKLLQELYERGHVYSDDRDQWVRWYGLLQPYLMQLYDHNEVIENFDKQMVSILSGDFFSSDVSIPSPSLLQQLEQLVDELMDYLDNKLSTYTQRLALITQPSNEQCTYFHPYRNQLSTPYDYLIVDMVEWMGSDQLIRQMIQAGFKRLFKLELALQYLSQIYSDLNLLTIYPGSTCYNDFLYLQENLLEFKAYLADKNKSKAVITKDEFRLFLEEKIRLEEDYIIYHQTVFDALKQKQVLSGKLNRLLVLSLFEDRVQDTCLSLSELEREAVCDEYAFFVLQKDYLDQAQTDYLKWLEYLNSYAKTCVFDDKQSAFALFFYFKSYLIKAFEAYPLLDVNNEITHDKLCERLCESPQFLEATRQIMDDFFSKKADELTNNITKLKRLAQQKPVALNASLWIEATDNRSQYLIKTTTGSVWIRQLKQNINDFQSLFFNKVVLQSMSPSPRLPFPDVHNPKQRLCQSSQLLSLKRVANLLYYSEEMVNELESIQTNAWYFSCLEFANKVTYVSHFVQVYLHSIQIQALLMDLFNDRYLQVFLSQWSLKNQYLAHHCHQTIQWYGSDPTANRSDLANNSVIAQWVTILKLLPEKLNSNNHEHDHWRVLLLKRSAEKTARDIETIISDVNPTVQYALLCLDGFKIRATLKDFKQLLYAIFLGVNKKATENLQAIHTLFLSELILEADLVEHQLGLKEGLLSHLVYRILHAFYEGLVTPLVDNVGRRLALCSVNTLMTQRLERATSRWHLAKEKRDCFKIEQSMIQTIAQAREEDVGILFRQSLLSIKPMLKGCDLHLKSLSDAVLQSVTDGFVWDHGSLYYIDLEGSIHGSQVGNLYLLRLGPCGEIPANLVEKPVLIQQGNRYFLYGNTNGTQWTRTELDAAIVSSLGLNFDPIRSFKLQLKAIECIPGQTREAAFAAIGLGTSCATLIKYGEEYFIYGREKLGNWRYTQLDTDIVKKSLIDFSGTKRIIIGELNAYKILYRHIVLLNGHKQDKTSLVAFHSKRQILYDEIVAKQAHIFPIQVKSIPKLYAMVAEGQKNYPWGTQQLYINEQLLKWAILDNSSFVFNKPTLDLNEHCWANLHAFDSDIFVRFKTLPQDNSNLDVILSDKKEVLFIKKRGKIHVCYLGLDNHICYLNVFFNSRLDELLNLYPNSFDFQNITNLPHVAEIKAQLTVLEINRLIQRVELLKESFDPTVREVRIIREVTTLCAQLTSGLLKDEILNEVKSEAQIKFLKNLQSIEMEKQVDANINHIINTICAQNTFSDWVRDEYEQTLKAHLRQLYDNEPCIPNFDKDSFFTAAKTAFDSTHQYDRLNALNLAVFEFDAYLSTCRDDKFASIKQTILSNLLLTAKNQAQTINKRMSLITDYLNQGRLHFLLTPPEYSFFSMAYWLCLVHQLLEKLGLRARKEVACVDSMVDSLLNKPNSQSHSLGFFSPIPTQAFIVSKWEQAQPCLSSPLH